VLLLLLAGCRSPGDPPTRDAPAASAAPAPVAAATPAASAKTWFEGDWQGSFKAELFRVETAAGGVKEWKQDDGKRGSGDGALSLQIAHDGSAQGTASGALGELVVSGRVDGDRAALRLASDEGDGFHGTILAAQTPDGMRGSLSASSGDSLQVRQASVTLTRK
jgi:hypothetical protein